MLIQTAQRGEIFEIILNRPEKRNAMSVEMMTHLEAAIDEAERAEGVRVVLLRGAGAAFCAGIDLAGLDAMVEAFGPGWRENVFPMTARYQGIYNKFERSSYPVIALLHGHCLGMGFELALACDFRIAAAGTKMGLPEATLGLIPDIGGTTRLTRLVGPGRAKELIMTGRRFPAEDAERWGIVNAVVEPGDLAARGDALAEELIAAAPLAVSYAKKVIDGIADIDRGLQLEAWAQSVLIRTDDFQVGAAAALLKQPAKWVGK